MASHLIGPNWTKTSKDSPILDVNAAVQLLRIRTCSDTLMLLASLVASHPISSTQCSTRESSVQKELTPDVYEQQQVSEDVVPDIADAMAELEMTEIEKDKKEQEKVSFYLMSIPQKISKISKDIKSHHKTSKDIKIHRKTSKDLKRLVCV
jgi:hypothetical protein